MHHCSYASLVLKDGVLKDGVFKDCVLKYFVLECVLALSLGCGSSSPKGASVTAGEEVIGSNDQGFEEFEKSVERAPETGKYMIDGDEPIDDIKHLREYYENSRPGALIVKRISSDVRKWSDQAKLDLSYCISDTFARSKETTVQAMRSAAEAWEAVANVKFRYVPEEDSRCTVENEQVLFDVQPEDSDGRRSGSAFFPGDPRKSRRLFLDKIAFARPFTVAGVLRHELGHVLGFRHEHIRPEANGRCSEDDLWQALTAYDRNSVMHYSTERCNGNGSYAMTITPLDAEGAAKLYGAPTVTPLYQPLPNSLFSSPLSEVAEGEERQLDPVDVAPGSEFVVTMKGTGDPDVYVRFDGPPAADTFDCRPFRTGADEECQMTVPEGKTKAYVSVRGYTAGSYTLELSYTKP